MSVTPEHEDLREMLPAAALEMLEMGEGGQVLAHVGDCPECAKLLAEYRDAAASLPLALPARPLEMARDRAVRARLMARARADHSSPRSDSRQNISFIYPWSGWMVAAGLSGLLLVHHSIHRPVDYGWLAAGILVFIALGFGIYGWLQRRQVAELEKLLAGRETKGTQDSQGGPRGGYSSVLSA